MKTNSVTSADFDEANELMMDYNKKSRLWLYKMKLSKVRVP